MNDNETCKLISNLFSDGSLTKVASNTFTLTHGKFVINNDLTAKIIGDNFTVQFSFINLKRITSQSDVYSTFNNVLYHIANNQQNFINFCLLVKNVSFYYEKNHLMVYMPIYKKAVNFELMLDYPNNISLLSEIENNELQKEVSKYMQVEMFNKSTVKSMYLYFCYDVII